MFDEPEDREHHRIVQERIRRFMAEQDARRQADKSAHAELVAMAQAGDKSAMLCLCMQGRGKMLGRTRAGWTYDRDEIAREREL